MHAGTTDPRELGKRSGEARRRPNSDRVHEGLRSYLKREADPARVWEAIQRALDGQNESARVSASKLLLDALYEPAVDACPVCKDREQEAPNVEKRLLELLARTDSEREAKIRAVVHAELAPLAEHVDTSEIEAKLVARL